MVNFSGQVQPWMTYKPAEIDILNEKPISISQALHKNTVDPLESAAMV